MLQGTTSVFPGMDHRMEFHGEKGTIAVYGEEITTWDVKEDSQSSEQESDIGGADVKIGSAANSPTDISVDGHQLQIQDLCYAIRENRDPMITGREARKAVEVILAIYKSAQTGLPVKMPLE